MIVGFTLSALGTLLLIKSPTFFAIYGWLAFASAVMGIGTGIAAPATQNAILASAKGDIAAAAGIQNMFRQAGGIFVIAVTTAVAARSTNEGIALGHCFFFYAVVLVVLAIPLVFTVPAPKGTW